jgi:hypothetical protein
LEKAKKMISFCFDDRAKVVDQDDLGFLLSVVEDKIDEGTRGQAEGVGADVIEGEGSDEI